MFAVRTFRINTDDGSLVPIAQGTHYRAWADGSAEAACAIGRDHRAPDEDCRCGLYAFGSAQDVTRQYAQARRVLAVVACHGRVVVGSRGVRAERARVVALWLDPGLPAALVERATARYPSIPRFTDRAAMLAEFPPSRMQTYSDPSGPLSSRRARLLFAVVVLAAAAVVYSGGALREPAQVAALLVALAGGGVSLASSLGVRGIGPSGGALGVGVMFVALALAVRGVPVSYAVVPFLVVVLCYLAVALAHRVAVRWGPICDGAVAFTPPLPAYLADLMCEPAGGDARAATYLLTDPSGRLPQTAVCVRRRGAGVPASVWQAREAVVVDTGTGEAVTATRCRRMGAGRRSWRVIGRATCSRSVVEQALGVPIPAGPLPGSSRTRQVPPEGAAVTLARALSRLRRRG